MNNIKLTQPQRLQVILIVLISLLLLTIIYPAWRGVKTHQALKSDTESGKTLAERYLLLGDWPSGNEDTLLANFDDFQVNMATQINESTIDRLDTDSATPPTSRKIARAASNSTQDLKLNTQQPIDGAIELDKLK